MKRWDIFCTSQASTAVCSNTDQHSSVLYSNKPPQHNQAPPSPLGHNGLRKIRTSVPCSSQPPITPRRSSFTQRVSSFTQRVQTSAPCPSQLPITPRRSSYTLDTRTSAPCSPHLSITPRKSSYTQKHQTPVPCSSQLPITSRKSSYIQRTHDSSTKELLLSDRRKSCADITDVSSRRFLGDRPFLEMLSDSDRIKPLLLKLKSVTPRLSRSSSYRDSSPPIKPPVSSTPRSNDQVVVLRVSLHCRGCEGKVRKHISRMEGVKSFDIDFTTKRVTIIGNLMPLEVLASVSKVKFAELWPNTSTSSSSSSMLLRLSILVAVPVSTRPDTDPDTGYGPDPPMKLPTLRFLLVID